MSLDRLYIEKALKALISLGRMLASGSKLHLLQVACLREDVAVKFVGQK